MLILQGSPLANSPQARKRARQETQHRARNMAQRAAMRTHIKKYLKSVGDGEMEVVEKEYRTAVSQIDRAARRGLHHRNKAARLKSRLNARLKSAVTPT